MQREYKPIQGSNHKKRHEVIQPEDRTIKYIALTKGQTATVDANLYDWLMQWNWFAEWSNATKTYYARRNQRLSDGRQRRVSMHREIMGIPYGDPREVDHREPPETLDNRRSNLRLANRSQNMHNRRINRNNTTGFKGVSFNKPYGKYAANISTNGNARCLGYFDEAEDAYAAYCKAAAEEHGDFARY